jgi:hypothetical protein
LEKQKQDKNPQSRVKNMKIRRLITLGAIAAIVIAAAHPLIAATLYVSQTSTNPTPPYATWDTAAQTIQEAVDASSDGDTVLVAAGEYRIFAQVTIVKAIALQSQSGPGPTTINANWNLAPRCLWMSHPSAVVDGFTIIKGRGDGTDLAGAVIMVGGVLSNCVVMAGSGPFRQGRLVDCSGGGLITDCRIDGHWRISATKGTGVHLIDSELRNSTISGMLDPSMYGGADDGAGIYAVASTITGCTISGNWARHAGGGAYLDGCVMDRCIITGNTVGVFLITPGGRGGGVFAINSVIRNSLIAANKADAGYDPVTDLPGGLPGYGGGIYLRAGSLLSCTVTGNRTVPPSGTDPAKGGGLYVETGNVRNSIIYFNSAPSDANWYWSDPLFPIQQLQLVAQAPFTYSCTTPDPGGLGLGNIVEEPQFVDQTNGNYRLSSTSPCIDAGFNQPWMDGAYDLDGNPRIRNGAVDMGAYETSDMPVIFSHPQSQAPPDGSNVTFRVTANGSPPLTYQWRKDGVAIPGATSAAMTLFNVTDADEGTYSVMLSNQFGTAVSSNALLTVMTRAVVTWLGPAHGESFPAGSDILLTTRATDPDGSVSYVEFYANGIKLGQVVSSTDLYEMVWSNAPSGTFALHVEAVDNDGARARDSVWIVVGEPGNALIGPKPSDRFGTAVASSGARVVVGAFGAGRAYVYDRASATPTIPVAILENPSPATPDFGWSVAISDNWVVVGAERGEVVGADTGGRAYVYDLGGATPDLPVATLENPNGTTRDHFGADVAVSGTLVVVGAKLESAGAMFAGAAYVYDLANATPTVPVVKLANPTPAEWDFFGSSVAISGTRVVVGAYEDDTGVENAGSAYVYDLASAAPTQPVVTLNNPSPGVNDSFGSDVAVSDTRIVVGKPTSRGGPGSAYVYDIANVTPSVPLATINYPVRGGRVAISGTRVIIGNAAGANAGIARVFDLASPTPTQPIATLNNPNNPDDPDPANVWFGFSVGISGAQVVIGAPNDTGGNGRAYLYDIVTQ